MVSPTTGSLGDVKWMGLDMDPVFLEQSCKIKDTRVVERFIVPLISYRSVVSIFLIIG